MIRPFLLGLLVLAVTWADHPLKIRSKWQHFDDKVWIFAVNNDFKLLEYVENGKQTGYTVDVIKRACQVARKRCEFVGVSVERDCVTHDDESGNIVPGRALFSGLVDACGSWQDHSSYRLIYKFAKEAAYTTIQPALYMAADKAASFSGDITGLKIAVFKATPGNKDCLAELKVKGHEKADYRIFSFTQFDAAIQKTVNGELDAAFLEIEPKESQGVVKVLEVPCIKRNAPMMRKDSTLDRWYDPALRVMKRDGSLLEICQFWEARKKEFNPDEHFPYDCLSLARSDNRSRNKSRKYFGRRYYNNHLSW